MARPVAYDSCSFKGAELNYPVHKDRMALEPKSLPSVVTKILFAGIIKRSMLVRHSVEVTRRALVGSERATKLGIAAFKLVGSRGRITKGNLALAGSCV